MNHNRMHAHAEILRKTSHVVAAICCKRKHVQQLSHWMGHDPVPCRHRGVELIERVDAMAGRQHSEKHSHSQFSLDEIREPREALFEIF